MNGFEKFNEEKFTARKIFYSSARRRKISNDGEISDGHVGRLAFKKIWD